MRTEMRIERMRPLIIGHEMDNLTGLVEIDCASWMLAYPELTRYTLAVAPPEGTPYFVPAELEGTILRWIVRREDTAKAGEGSYQIIGTGENGEQKSTDFYPLYIYSNMPGLDGASETPPEAALAWVSKVLDAADRAEEAAKRAENAGGSSESGGAVNSVNGKTGAVQLTAADVGAADAKETAQAFDALSEEIGKKEKPLVYIDGVIPTTKDDVLAELTYMHGAERWHAYIEIKCQGTSSMNYDKKNFTVKLYEDEARNVKMKRKMFGWPVASNKYVLKANYIDRLHARNIVSARLWGEIVASRSDYDTLPDELRNSPNNGAVDGYPIIVYTNGNYQGVYTWNIGKDDWMWGMDDDNPNHVLMCAETNTDNEVIDTPCNFRALWSGVHEEDWSVEVGTNSDALKNSMNSLISYVKDTTDEEFVAQANTYLDIQSAIDYYIFAYVNCGIDSLAKNMLLGTYDLTKWRCGAYDLDSTWGMYWYGTPNVPANRACPEEYQEKRSLLWERIEALFGDRMRERYHELRKTVLSYANIVSHFERFVDEIGDKAYADDLVAYPGIPCPDSNTIWQIRNFVRDRLAYCDSQMSEMKTMYELTAPAVFGGTVDDAINTNVKLWAEDVDFTIAADLTPAAQTARADAVWCHGQGSPWPGFDFSVYSPSSNYVFTVAGEEGNQSFETNIKAASTDRLAFIVTHVAGSSVYDITLRVNGATWKYSAERTFVRANNSAVGSTNMWLGCADGDTTPGRPWSGTMNRFGLYGRVMTDAEITAYLSAID